MKKSRRIFTILIIFMIFGAIINPVFALAESNETTVTADDTEDGVYWTDDSYDGGNWGYDDYYYEDDMGMLYEETAGVYAIYRVISFLIRLVGLVVIIAIVVVIYKKVLKKSGDNMNHVQSGMGTGYAKEPDCSENQVVSEIRRIDQDFSREEFLSWAKDVFVKLQYAWSDRDLDIIRCFETPQLFEHHRDQIQNYIDNGQINKLEKVSINWAKLFEFSQDGSRDVLTILLNSKMLDYIVNANTGKIVKGSNTDFKTNTYKLTFVRTSGVKTKVGTTSVNITNCPNCGAPVEITSAGKCSYCGSVITTGNFNWVLSNMELYTGHINDWTAYNDGNIGGFGTGIVTGAIVGGLAGGIMRDIFRPRPYGGPHGGGPRGGFGGPGGRGSGGPGGFGGGPRGGGPGGGPRR